jgi:uncharacterized lipoprotein YajG
MQRAEYFLARSSALAGVTLMMLASGCATGPSNVIVNVAPYVVQSTEAAGSKGMVRVDAAKDARREATGAMIGDRTGLGNMSMGSVATNPAPATLVTSVIKDELDAMGFDASGTGNAPVVSTQLIKFQIVTPATALYWDINGAIEIALTATGLSGKSYGMRHAVQCTARTYAWPGEDVIGGVITSCLKQLGDKVKGDTALADVLSGR